MTIYLQHYSRTSPTANWKWNACKFLKKHHTKNKMAPLNDSATSFTLYMHWRLALQRNASCCSWCRFVRWVLHHCTICSVSHMYVRISCVAQKRWRISWQTAGLLPLKKTWLAADKPSCVFKHAQDSASSMDVSYHAMQPCSHYSTAAVQLQQDHTNGLEQPLPHYMQYMYLCTLSQDQILISALSSSTTKTWGVRLKLRGMVWYTCIVTISVHEMFAE